MCLERQKRKLKGTNMNIVHSADILLLRFFLAALFWITCTVSQADTVAYWRFEEGPVNEPVPHPAGDGVFYPGALDSSGYGNHLSAWQENWAGYAYRADVGLATIPLTKTPNVLSVQNIDSFPGMFTQSSVSIPVKNIETIEFSQFTIEAFFKPESGDHRTIVGRDARYVADENDRLAALYFQLLPGNAMAIKYADVQGYWHEAISASGVIQGFSYSSDPTGTTGKWYYAAAVCNGTILSLYLANITDNTGLELIAQSNLTLSGSTNTAIAKGTTNGSDWHAGGWSVGRGLYDGSHTDRAWGFIDEVRISDTALTQQELLLYSPQQSTLMIEPAGVIVMEEGQTSAEIEFSLNFAPVSNVLISFTESSSIKQIALNKSLLTFTPENWNTSQAIVITAIDDDILENAEHRTYLNITITSNDPAYDERTVNAIPIAVLDNECGAWGYALADFNMNCLIDLGDLAELAQWWLICSLPQENNCINFNL